MSNVRIEPLQTITQEEAREEGVYDIYGNDHVACFAALWDQLNGKRGYSFESNPWVWVISFELLEI